MTDTALYTEDEWLEFLEGETGPLMKKEMEDVLKNSLRDREILESLQHTIALLKSQDDCVIPEDGRFYDRLHTSIMNEINDQSLPSPTPQRKRGALRSLWSTAFFTVMILMLLGLSLREIHSLQKNQQENRLSRTVQAMNESPGPKASPAHKKSLHLVR